MTGNRLSQASRRNALKSIGSSVFTFIPVVGNTQSTTDTGHSFNFLTSGDTTTNGPEIEMEEPQDGEVNIDRELASTDLRLLKHMTEGGVSGKNGRLTMGCETTRTARFQAKTAETKEVRVVAEGGQAYKKWNYGTNGRASLGHSAGLVVKDLTAGESLTHNGRAIQAEATAEASEWVVEKLLTRLTKRVLFPAVTGIAGLILSLTLDALIGQAIEFDANNTRNQGSRGWDSDTFRATFETQPDHTYEVGFTVTGGFSAETPYQSDTYGDNISHALAESQYLLNEFTVKPTTTWP